MRLGKVPMALIIAAAVSFTAVTVYLYISVIPIPVVADSNFTGTLVAGSAYLWRGSASTFEFSSNATIQLTYAPVGYVVSVNGPLSNITLGKGAWLIYLNGGRPLLVMYFDAYLVAFKLVPVSSTNGVTVLVPQPFDMGDYLTDNELNAIETYTGVMSAYRVTNVVANNTYITLEFSLSQYSHVYTYYDLQLPTPVSVTSATYHGTGYGVSYKVGNATVSAYVAPYEHFVITPLYNAQVTILVK
jgi:hypothetical protein